MGSSIPPEAPPPLRTRDSVFISYARKDEKWLKRLETHLKPRVRTGAIKVWSDAHIQAGAEWRAEIEEALAHAKVAVLLVSADFLASDFIARHELPPLLSAAEHEGLKILWVPIRPSNVDQYEIGRYQSPLNASKSLAEMRPLAKAEAALVRVCDEIEKALNAAPC